MFYVGNNKNLDPSKISRNSILPSYAYNEWDWFVFMNKTEIFLALHNSDPCLSHVHT